MTTHPNFTFHDLCPVISDVAARVLSGLKQKPKNLPHSLLYDEEGSRLFEAICEEGEYYITHAELSILEEHRREIHELLGENPAIIELGAGSHQKIRALLSGFDGPAIYVPIDISRDRLRRQAEELAGDLPHLNVAAVCADFTSAFPLPTVAENNPRKVVFFPGSTIGNYEHQDALALLRKIRSIVGNEGAALIGVDLRKDSLRLLKAYNDSSGATERFELHVLERLNREMKADFDLGAFQYLGIYDAPLGRVEMYLFSRKKQVVNLLGKAFIFEKGEAIHIEDSYKYSIVEFGGLAWEAGFDVGKTWTDDERLFSLHWLLPRPTHNGSR